jgi:hypothetical protein
MTAPCIYTGVSMAYARVRSTVRRNKRCVTCRVRGGRRRRQHWAGGTLSELLKLDRSHKDETHKTAKDETHTTNTRCNDTEAQKHESPTASGNSISIRGFFINQSACPNSVKTSEFGVRRTAVVGVRRLAECGLRRLATLECEFERRERRDDVLPRGGVAKRFSRSSSEDYNLVII